MRFSVLKFFISILLLAGFLHVSGIHSHAQTPASGDVVISQIYSGGGQVGSTFQNNYIELFNRSNAVVDIGGWPIGFTSATGDFTFFVAFVSSRGIGIAPGKYLLIQLGPASANGAPLPVTPDFDDHSQY